MDTEAIKHMGGSTAYTYLTSIGTSTMAAALAAKENPAMVRAILYICRCQRSNLVGDIITQLPLSTTEGIALALIICANKDSSPATQEEVSVLFAMLSAKLAGRNEMEIDMDYHPSPGVVTDILREWVTLIENHRCQIAPTQALKLPMTILPNKTSIRVRNGCAMRNHDVIDDHGEVLKENPHETAYNSQDPKDISTAFHLQPVRAAEWDVKFTNSKIASAMGYTIDDAPLLCRAGNYGVVEYLVERVPEFTDDNTQVVTEILKILCAGSEVDRASIALEIFKRGYPIMECGNYHPFFTLIQKLEAHDLKNLLSSITSELWGFQVRDFRKCLCYSITARYIKYHYAEEEFNQLCDFWCNITPDYTPTGTATDTTTRTTNGKKSKQLDLCQEVLERAQSERREFRTPDFANKIAIMIKNLSKSEEEVEFDRRLADIKQIPRHYRGTSDMRACAKPHLDKLYEAYQKLSTAERASRLGECDAAAKCVDEMIKSATRNVRKGY